LVRANEALPQTDEACRQLSFVSPQESRRGGALPKREGLRLWTKTGYGKDHPVDVAA